MSAKRTPASLGSASFNCPHCGTLTHQFWFKAYADGHSKDESPSMSDAYVLNSIVSDPNMPSRKLRSRFAEARAGRTV